MPVKLETVGLVLVGVIALVLLGISGAWLLEAAEGRVHDWLSHKRTPRRVGAVVLLVVSLFIFAAAKIIELAGPAVVPAIVDHGSDPDMEKPATCSVNCSSWDTPPSIDEVFRRQP